MTEPSVRVRTFTGYAMLPEEYRSLFHNPRSGNLFHSREWLENFALNGLEAGDRIRLYAVESGADGAPLALWPAVYSRLYSAHPLARVVHFRQPEDLPFEPLLAPGDHDPRWVVQSVFEFLRAHKDSYDVVRVSPIDPESSFGRSVYVALNFTRHALQTYPHLADRYATVAKQSFEEYLAGRPRLLREALGSTGRLLLAGGRASFDLVRTVPELEEAWPRFLPIVRALAEEAQPEPPNYLSSLMYVAAQAGALRLGILSLDGTPAAAQLWIVTGGSGHCIRIWGIQLQRGIPLDDLLTQCMAEQLINADRVLKLNYGAIVGEFARNWAPEAQERMGIAAFNLRTWRGIKGAARHVGGQYIKSIPRRIWRRISGGR